MKNWKVYAHINKFNLKMYIGITSQIPKRRWGLNGKGYTGCIKFVNAIQKYGWNNFEHIVLIENLSETEACQLEQILIQKFKTIEFGYNQESGGIGGLKSEEAKEKIRTARINQIFTPEMIQKSADAHRGRKNTPETIALMRESAKERFVPVVCIETNEYYPCIAEASKDKNISRAAIRKSASRYKSNINSRNRGLHWKYA